ncbi:hypothetical protein KA107_03410 [Candidatus Pacearchaeota archaeon]|nr:hypothetical protein [Candidatus Pacearchaeota archaeon]
MGDGLEDSFSEDELRRLRDHWANQEYLTEFGAAYRSLEYDCPDHPLLKFVLFEDLPNREDRTRNNFTFLAASFFEIYKEKIASLDTMRKSINVYFTLVRIESRLAEGRAMKRNILKLYEELQMLYPEEPVLKLANINSAGEITFKDISRLREFAEITQEDLRIFERKEKNYFRIENFYMKEYLDVLEKRHAQVIAEEDGKGISLEYPIKNKPEA